MLLVGQKLYGYCGGEFGRDHYEDCRIEAVGVDWIVVRSEGRDYPEFACGPTIHDDLQEYTNPEKSYDNF